MDEYAGLFGVLLLFLGWCVAMMLPAPKTPQSTDDLIAEIVRRVGERKK